MTFLVQGQVTPDDSVSTAKIKSDAVTSAKIADDAIDSEHYTDGSIDNAHIADDAIDSEHYAAGSIDTAHIADNQITLAKMAGGTDGNLITYDASGDPAAVATGSDGQVLTSAGAGQPPAFEAAAGSSDYFLATQASAQAITTSTATVINFNAESFDTGSNFNLSTDKYVVPSDGKYWFYGVSGIDTLSDGDLCILDIKKGGTTIASSRDRGIKAGDDKCFGVGIVLDLETDDEMTLSIYHDYGANRNTFAGADVCFFSGYRLGD